MKHHSNSIEGYCSNPLPLAELTAIETLMADRTQKRWRTLWCYAGVLAILYGVVLAFLGPLGSGTFIASMVFICFFSSIGMLISEAIAPQQGVNIIIHGDDLATGTDFIHEVEAPDEESVASPLGKTLIKSIRAQDRKMRAFEKNLLNRLCTF
ncbi:hypothetical protein IFT48_03205 [Pseudomonas fluorescens]|uniref:hypothetical protein n=1 Tax=Pseudomonas fluorescens TaxID=294 RepID=UPI001930C6C0|nr:hypothetical protein [Pseudomonas fluorescens]MBD8088976.1 hypothetical protein [Pseudomonas fluorescens]